MATKVISTKHILRNDTAANWLSVDPILAKGEMGIETDTRKVKIGDGVTVWSGLDYIVGNGGADTRVVNVTATASGWTGAAAPYRQTIHVDGMTATCMALVSYPSIITDTEYSVAMNGELSCTAQRTGEIDLVAMGEKPTSNIPIQVVIGLNFTQDGSYLGTERYWEPLITTSGSNTILSLPDLILESYDVGRKVSIFYTGANTSSAYINIANLGQKAVLGDLEQNTFVDLYYDGSQFVVKVGGAKFDEYTATIPTTGWSSTAPYTQTITVSGITADDLAFISPIYSSAVVTRALEKTAWGCVTMIETQANSIKVTCDDEVPLQAVNIKIVVAA